MISFYAISSNIILDVLLDRQPFSKPAAYLMSKVERSELLGYVYATTITTIHYLISKNLGDAAAKQHIGSLLTLFEIAPVTRTVLESALSSKFKDFEDAVLHESTIHVGAKYIVTRNVCDFKCSMIPVFEPVELTNIIEN
ncbi:PIN domain-containing protein [Deferribacter autotrophicus]|uniref:PIN domain-containing protein n=1 Tax=Deferribacter autotrophicus TaxID=500465 RepID=A0A5A8F7Q0_9BACT|nr:PIN domain-containing protein [Deferribacter autotrophicus]KAA0259469.1 PIN domain-containing protein [Deferribacter autotrophicus]